jgi:uncharacterized membrane protein required for colicin V production
MDPITGAVVAIVLWFVSISIVWFVIVFGCALIGHAIADEDGGALGSIIGWVLGAVWAVIAVIQIILEVSHLLNLIAG